MYYTLILIGILITGAWVVIAYSSIPNPGHGADTIKVNTSSGIEKTLQQAINDGDFGGGGSSGGGSEAIPLYMTSAGVITINNFSDSSFSGTYIGSTFTPLTTGTPKSFRLGYNPTVMGVPGCWTYLDSAPETTSCFTYWSLRSTLSGCLGGSWKALIESNNNPNGAVPSTQLMRINSVEYLGDINTCSSIYAPVGVYGTYRVTYQVYS